MLHHKCQVCTFTCTYIVSASPSQYLGKHTPVAVKDRIKALLYSWKAGLPSEGKIAEAYEMLKKEGKH